MTNHYLIFIIHWLQLSSQWRKGVGRFDQWERFEGAREWSGRAQGQSISLILHISNTFRVSRGQAGSEWEPHFLLSTEGKTVSSQSSSSCQGWRWGRLKAVRRSGRRSNWRKAISRNSQGLWTTARWQQGSGLTVQISGILTILNFCSSKKAWKKYTNPLPYKPLRRAGKSL